mmetsp:Transcript_29357/g.77106  ORF Transcript_29357/g.77106 Transcript_29357/m.77106 type:complete len:122 (-) Transcript_29357:6-371(-)
MLAWMLERVIGALHCSLRGAQLLVKHGQEAANRANLLPQHLKLAEGSPTFTAVVGAVAAVGFINQVASMEVLLRWCMIVLSGCHQFQPSCAFGVVSFAAFPCGMDTDAVCWLGVSLMNIDN